MTTAAKPTLVIGRNHDVENLKLKATRVLLETAAREGNIQAGRGEARDFLMGLEATGADTYDAVLAHHESHFVVVHDPSRDGTYDPNERVY